MPIEQREASNRMPMPGEIVELPYDPPVLFRVDRVLVAREVSARRGEEQATHALDGMPLKVTIHGEVVTP